MSNTTQEDFIDIQHLLPEAERHLREVGRISTTVLQRRMKIGYVRASRIIDALIFTKRISDLPNHNNLP